MLTTVATLDLALAILPASLKAAPTIDSLFQHILLREHLQDYTNSANKYYPPSKTQQRVGKSTLCSMLNSWACLHHPYQDL
jgi:hypothetical protein